MTTAKIMIAPALLSKTKFDFQKKNIKKCKPDMEYHKIAPLTLIKHLCHTSALETTLMQRKLHLTYHWLERKRKNKSFKFSQLLCLNHLLPCS